MHTRPVVIVGGGLAAYTLVRELRKLDPVRPVTLVSADSGDYYSKPMLSNALDQRITPEALVRNTAHEQAKALNIRVLSHCQVIAIDRGAKRLLTSAGALDYGALVLAVGAEAGGADQAAAAGSSGFAINHLDDYRRFRGALSPGKRVLIIGAGLVGCEFANDLAATGHAVTLLESGEHILGRLIPTPLAEHLQKALQGVGVRMHCRTKVQSINQVATGIEVALGSGERIEADLLLWATGLRPRLELARDCGLETGKGIRVNRFLATEDPQIFALGDCAEVDGQVLPFVLPLMHQARALAATLSGTPRALSLPALPIILKTPACPIVVVPPLTGQNGTWRAIETNPDGMRFDFVDAQGQLVGFALSGRACEAKRQLAARIPAWM